jgi:hypothetical protein
MPARPKLPECGAKVALPIFRPIIEAIWARNVTRKAPLSGPSPDAQRRLVDLTIDYESGDRVRRSRGFVEHFRLGPDNAAASTMKARPATLSSMKAITGLERRSTMGSKRMGEGGRRPAQTTFRLAITLTIGSNHSAAGTRVIFRANIIRETRATLVISKAALPASNDRGAMQCAGIACS